MHFAALDMRHPLLSSHALQQKVYSHYMRAALPSLVRLVGSSSLLGALWCSGHGDQEQVDCEVNVAQAGACRCTSMCLKESS